MSFNKALCSIGLLLFSFGSHSVLAQNVGDWVVATEAAELNLPNQTVDSVPRGMLLKVENVEGNWLWISNRKSGWIDKALVVPVEQAADHFTAAIQQDPHDALAYLIRADLHYREGRPDLAISDYDKVILLQTDFPVAYNNRGNLFAAQGKYDHALADYDKAIELDPQYSHAFNNRGIVRMAQGDLEQAIADFDRAISLDPDYVEAFANRGAARQTLGEYDQALADFREAIRRHPGAADVFNDIAWLLATCPAEAVRDGQRAVQNARQACELSDWQEPQFLDTLAAAYAETGNFDEAIKWQSKAVELAPDAAKKEMAQRLENYRSDKPYRGT